ncbi:MAG TPA: hypothetical protein PLZ21_02755 [Armatimonadota bacterium]|nr:hypothetical protein [Armatimonadota bacterium]HOP79463.1 hypothetical protein [Armatimonadota bacterium]
MDEFEMMLAEAQTIGEDILVELDRAGEPETSEDAKDVIQSTLRAGEEMMKRLEEAMELADSEDEAARVETIISRVEDAMDAGQVALGSGDFILNMEEMRLRMNEAVTYLSSYQEVEEE